jgi:8-oxo-dGTP diphosphatase
MTERSTIIVAAGVVIEDGRVLLAQRKRGTHLEGAWELPGGKVEDGEDPRTALRRELAEELGILVRVGDIVEVTFHRYEEANKNVLLLFFDATRLPESPAPQALDVASFEWAGPSQLVATRFPPADLGVVAKVRSRLEAVAPLHPGGTPKQLA